LTKLLKQFVKAAETLLGIKLLPEPKSAVKKKRKKSKSKVAAVDHDKTYVSQNEEEKETTGSKTPTAKAKVSASGGSKSAVNTQKHLVTKISSTNPNYRIQRELKEFIRSPPPNLSVKVGSNIRIWIIQMVGAKNTIYEGEVYKLRVQFPKDYPTVPPSVYFLQPTPQHEHVYTNGDICLSLLGKDWRPTMTAQSIAVSILSILSSAQSKSLPMDNARHSQNKPGQYQKDWIYHDDNC
jgi:ubiquitin-conjugating enzyme E2 W